MRVSLHNPTTASNASGMDFVVPFEPVVTVETSDNRLNDWPGGLDVLTLNIDNGEMVSKFWVNVVVKNGKPMVTLITKPDKERTRQETVKLTGSFNIPKS